MGVLCGFLVLGALDGAPNIIADMDLASRVASTSSVSCIVRSRLRRVKNGHVLFLISYHTSTKHEGVISAGVLKGIPVAVHRYEYNGETRQLSTFSSISTAVLPSDSKTGAGFEKFSFSFNSWLSKACIISIWRPCFFTSSRCSSAVLCLV